MNRFQTDNVFSDSAINALCDRVYDILNEAFPPGEGGDPNAVYKNFLLSGRAADIKQGASSQPILNIIFMTSSETYFEFCKNKLPEVLQCTSMAFKDRVLLYPLGYYFEIWFQETPVTNAEIDSIYYQLNTQIPTETK